MNTVITKICRTNKRGLQYSIEHAEKALVARVGRNESGVDDRVALVRSSLPEWATKRYNAKIGADALEAGCRSSRVKQKVKYMVHSFNAECDGGNVDLTVERADKFSQAWLKKWARGADYYYFVHTDHAHVHVHMFASNWNPKKGTAIDWKLKDLAYMQSLRWLNAEMPDLRPGADMYDEGGFGDLTYTRDSEGSKEELAWKCLGDPAATLNMMNLPAYKTEAKNGKGGGQPGIWWKGKRCTLASLNSLMRRKHGRWQVGVRDVLMDAKHPQGLEYVNYPPPSIRTPTQQQTVHDFRMGYWQRACRDGSSRPSITLDEYDALADTPVKAGYDAGTRTIATELKRKTLGAQAPHPKSNYGVAQYIYTPEKIPSKKAKGEFTKVLEDLGKQLSAQNPEAYKRAITLKEFERALMDLMDAVGDILVGDDLPQLQAGDIIVSTPPVEVPILNSTFTPPPAEDEMDRAIQRALAEVPPASLVPHKISEEGNPPVVEKGPKVSPRWSRALPPSPLPDLSPDL